MKINHIHRLATIAATLAISLFAVDASAQQAGSMKPGMMDMSQTKAADDPSTAAYKQNARKMMQAIASKPFTGDADADFVAHMIPHHQGAVDQAQVELKYGKDPQMKALAAEILKGQPQEIDTMRKWQTEHAAK